MSPGQDPARRGKAGENMPADEVIAVIFAGGVGSRMLKAQLPKQFMSVKDKPVLIHTLDHFQRHEQIDRIFLACLPDFIDHTWALVEQFGISKVCAVTPGGKTAQHSIINAMRCALDEGVSDEAITLVHDGVRPIINAELISQNIATTAEHGNAITAIPCFETIAMSLDGAQTVDSVTQRDLMYVLQAPQTFRLGAAYRANIQSMEDGLLGKFVDQAHLMKHYGTKLHMVPGFRGNTKLTTDFDLLQFQLLVDSGTLTTVTPADLA
jgi:2-C-methyl-D-erythritol 4-phosphate cytidylyltransferase